MADPVSIIVSPIVKVVINYAASVVMEKYELLQGLEDDIKNLSSKLTAIQSVLEDAENKQLDNASMRDWLGKLKEVVYNAEDLLKLLAAEALVWKKKQRQVRNFQPPLIGATRRIGHKMNVAEEIKEILVRLDEIGKERSQFHLNPHSVDNSIRSTVNLSNHTSPMMIESDIVGREEDKEKIVEMLLRGDDGSGGMEYVKLQCRVCQTKKQMVDVRSGAVYIMLHARSFDIAWGQSEHWSWNHFEETSDENAEVAKLNSISWLDIRGNLKTSELSPGFEYDVKFMVKLSNGASGWEFPIKLQLTLPNKRVRERNVTLVEKPKEQWIELNVGSFLAQENEQGEVRFALYEHGRHWKTGLLFKGAIVRPKKKVY